jgi:hypothetical protein
MSTQKIVAPVLIVLGVVALAYGGFTYTTERHEAQIGPIEISVTEKERVNIPIWAGIGAIVTGALILGFGGRR